MGMRHGALQDAPSGRELRRFLYDEKAERAWGTLIVCSPVDGVSLRTKSECQVYVKFVRDNSTVIDMIRDSVSFVYWNHVTRHKQHHKISLEKNKKIFTICQWSVYLRIRIFW